MDRQIEQAAWNLGANEVTAFIHVVLPQLKAAIAASFMLAFAVSWDEFIIAWLLSGLDVTIPVFLWTTFQGQISAKVNAIGAVCFVVSLVAFAATGFLMSRGERAAATGIRQ